MRSYADTGLSNCPGQRRQAGSCASASSTVSSLGDFLGRDKFEKGDIDGSVGALGSVLLVDGSQAFLGKAVRDTNESWP